MKGDKDKGKSGKEIKRQGGSFLKVKDKLVKLPASGCWGWLDVMDPEDWASTHSSVGLWSASQPGLLYNSKTTRPLTTTQHSLSLALPRRERDKDGESIRVLLGYGWVGSWGNHFKLHRAGMPEMITFLLVVRVKKKSDSLEKIYFHRSVVSNREFSSQHGNEPKKANSHCIHRKVHSSVLPCFPVFSPLSLNSHTHLWSMLICTDLQRRDIANERLWKFLLCVSNPHPKLRTPLRRARDFTL